MTHLKSFFNNFEREEHTYDLNTRPLQNSHEYESACSSIVQIQILQESFE